jgi:predicted Zn-dependent protease
LNSACKDRQCRSRNVPAQFDDDMTRTKELVSAASLSISIVAFTVGCAIEDTSAPPREPSRETSTPKVKPLDPSQAARLQRIMLPLLRAGNKTRSLKEIRVRVIEDPSINAANAGGGEFYVTTGLLQKANDEHLTGVLAHEIAHDDLGHVARAQILGVGLNVGVILLEQLLPGSSVITPALGTLAARAYSRSEELEADRHAVEILQRAGYSKDVMIDALAWVMQSSPPDGGGFLSTHPATQDRIAALRQL